MRCYVDYSQIRTKQFNETRLLVQLGPAMRGQLFLSVNDNG
jgi:hypothetical protein